MNLFYCAIISSYGMAKVPVRYGVDYLENYWLQIPADRIHKMETCRDLENNKIEKRYC